MIRLKNWFRRITNFSQPLLVGVCAFIFATSVFANPVLDNVAAGQVTIQQDTHSTIVNQTSQQAIVNWQSFNIGAQESTHFQQPAGGVALNRINPSQGVSEIYGRLTATGQIILVNPAGIFFGPGSYVNVGGLIASTANISNEDFLNNYYHFANVPGYNGAIVNQGQIIAAEHGLVALVGGAVSNEGLIQANIGHAVLASGNSFTMSFAGNDLIGFSVDSAATQRAIDKNGRELSVGANNSGTISANGGRILISAKAAAGILDNIINMQGIAQAQSFYESKGTIIMSGDTESGIVNIGGVVDVSGVLGGNIDITGYNILLGDNTLINANGNFGGGNINIGGNYLGQGPLPTANAVVLADGATITANAINAGNGGRVIVWSDYFTNANGSISATGGGESGNGGFIETSSKNILNVGDILVNTSAANGATGTWLLDPYDITISSSASSNGAFNGSNPNLFTPTGDANVLDSTINTNLGSANVTITTGNSGSPGSSNGNITVDATAAINWSSANTLTLTAYRNITIDNGATITATGGGILNLIANNSGFFPLNSDGTVTNNGAGNINVNGGLNVYYNPANYSSPLTYVNGTGSSTAYMYVNSAADLQNMSTNLAGFYALSTNISAGSFTPIGTLATPFTGGFDGLNHVITGLTISGATNNAGLFGVISSNNIFKNLHLANVNINHTTFATATGAFAGSADGNITITDISSTGSISGYYTGGIIGALNRISGSGTLSHAWSTATISGGGDTGGIVGAAALSTISNSYFGGTINNGGTFSTTGGILGFAAFASSVVDSYNTGTVNGGNFSSTGGIVGFATSGGTIDRSYNSGSVSGSGFVGSIVGQLNNGKTMTNSFWDTDTSGQSASYGTISGGASESNNFGGCFTGTCTNGGTVNLSDMGTYATWSISNTPSPNSVAPTQTWFIFQGATRPMLTMEQQENISNAHQLQMMGSTLGGIYTLENNIDFNSITRTADVWNMNFSTPTGAGGFVPIALGTNFSGSFDGQNNTITDLYINRAANNIGLFSTISSTATVSNLGLLSGSVTGSNNVGSVAGTNNGTITNSYNTGAFTATQYSGGIVGRNYGTVSDSYNTGNGTDSTGCVNCGYDVGGIAGRNETTGVISNSYNTGNITGVYGYNNKAGIAATNAGLITNSYNLGTITADYFHLGGIGGITTNNSGTISNSYNAGTVRSTSFANYGANGGIAAYNSGIITNTYNSGIVVFSGSLIGTIGGLVGENSGQITSSYNIGSVTAYDQAGGIVGNNVAAGVINNVYNMGSIVSTNNVNSGGIAGLNSGTISNTYSAGYVTPNSTSGGIIGANSVNTVTNSFWDSVTTGQASAVNSGTTTATMVAGSFDGTSGVNMKLANTFTSAPYNWDFATVWNIVSGQSYPYLRAFYSTTPRIISGTTGANANTSVNIIVNGAVVDSTITTALNTTSRYYLLQGLNNISGIDNSIADNTPILLYLNNGAQRANTVTITPNATGSLSNSTDVGLVNSTLTIGSAGVPPVTFSNSQLATLLGGLNNTDADFLYTYSGNNITLNSSNHFSAISNSSFTLDGNLATTAGNMTFSGPLAISGSRSLTSTTSGDITISSALNSPTAGLTINSAGTASLSTITSLTDLTVTAASGITVNGDITTSGNQTYSGVMTLLPASTTTFTTTGAGDITFNNHLISNNGINFAGSGVHTNAAGQVIFNGNIGNNAVQIDSVNLTAAGGIYFNGSSISTNQSQTYNSPIHLTGTVNFTNYLLAPIQFLSTIDGPGSFTSNFYSGSFAGTNPQVVTFGGAIGAATPLNNFTLSINQSAGVTFNNTLDASGAINITAAGGFFNATSTPPNVVFNAPVGSLTIPTSLSVTSAVAFVSYTPSIQFNNSVNTSGALTLSSRCDGPICTLNGPVTLNGTVGTLANPLGSLSALGSQINLNMDYIYSNGAQTYTGPVLLNSAGTASLISNNSNITMSSTVTGNGSNTLAITNASSSSISGVISNLALTKNGAGTLILVNNNTYTGGTTINAGTLQVGNGGATGAITGNIANSTSLVVNTANSFPLSGIISGNGSLTKSGSGTLTLSGTNTYGGNTTLNAGTIVIDANSIGSPVITSGPVGTGQLLLNGGTLASAGSYNILNPYTVAGSVALDGGTSLTLSGAGTLSSGSLNVLGSTVILSGDLTGSAPINALNTGNTFLTLSRVGGNNNGYSGTISFIGYLTAGAATNSFGTGSLIFATAGAESNLSSSVGAVINNNWTVNNGGSSASLSGSLTMGPTGTGSISNGSTLYLSDAPGDTLTLSGNLTGSGTIINNNGFSPIISGNNTNFTGTFNLDTATTTIISSATNALGTGALIINNGALTTTTNTTLGNSSVTVTGNAQLTGANDISIAAPISLSSGTLFVTNTAGTVALSGNISGSAPINKSGGGTLTISGGNNSGFLGATTLSSGQLNITSLTNGLGSGVGAILNLNGGTLSTGASGVVIANPYTVGGAATVATGSGFTLALNGAGTLNSGSFAVDGTNGAVTLGGQLSGSIPLNLSATNGTVNIGGALVNNSTYSGNVTATGSSLVVGIYSPTNALGVGGTVTLAGGGLYAMTNTTIANPIIMTAGGGLRGNSGTLTLTGSMTLNSGTLSIINSNNAINLNGDISGSGGLFTQNNNGTVTFNGSNTSWSGPIQLNGTGSIVVGTALNPLGTGDISWENNGQTISSSVTSGPTVFDNDFTVSVFGATLAGVNDMTFNGSFDINTIINGFSITNTGTTRFNGNFTGNGALLLDAGTVVIASPTANSSYTGYTGVAGGATLRISTTAASALGSGTLYLGGGSLQSSVTATLTNPFTLSASSTINGSNNLSLSGAGALDTGTLTITNSATTSLSGVLSSAGGITLNSSSGTLNLTNSNTYTGATTISSGTLNVTAFANNGSASSIGAGTVLNIGASGVLQYTGGSAASTNRTIGLTGSGATIDASGGLLTLSGSVTGTNTNLNLIGSGSGALTNSIGTGNGTLTKDGSGTWTLGNANTYTGATFINGGTLSVGTLANYGSNSSLGAAASPTAITLSGGGILSYTGAPVTMNRNISTSTGGGTFLTTNTSISTPFVLSGNIDNANGLTLSSRYLQATGVISGAGNLTLTSSQTNARIDLTNALNSYTGQTIATHASSNGLAVYASSIADGGVNSALGATVASTPISLNNAGLIYTGGAASSDRQIIMSGTSPYVMNLGSGKLTLNGNIATNATYATFDAGANQLDLNGVISGNSSYIYFLAPANSTIRINNTANTFTGTARLTSYLYSGNVVITSLADAGVPSSLGAGTGNLFYVAGQDGPSTLVYTGGTTSTNRGIAMEYFYGAEPIFTNASAGTTVTFTGGIDLGYMNFNFANMVGDVVLSGQIIGSEYARILTSGTGAGSLTINNNTNTFGGGVFLTGGILNYTSVSAINGGASALGSSDGTYGLWIGGTGILRYIGSSPATTNRSITLTSSGGTLENASSSALTFSGNVTGNTFGLNLSGTGNSTLSGIIGTTTGGLTKSGSGTWTLGNANTYTGATSITGGTLSVGTLANSGSNSSLGAGATAISLSGGGILSYTGATTSTNRQFATSGTGGTIQNTTANTLTLSGAIDNSGSDLTLNTTNSSGNITASNSSNSISGAGSLTKSGTGTLTLSGLNSYTGATFINAGTLVASNASSLGSGATQSSSTTIASGATLSLQTSLSNTNQITLSGSGNGSLSALVNTTFTQRTLSNPLVLAGNTTIGGSFGELILTGNVTESSVGSILTKTGNSTIYLRGDNSFTGATNVSQGMLAITSANGLGSGLTQSNGINVTSGASLYFDAAITLNNTSTITLAGTGVAPSFGALTYASGSGGNVILNNPITLASNINIGAANGGGSDHLVLNGNITGAFSITKEGLIALDLNGNNSYSGGTTINGSSFGRIEVGHASALGTGPININSGGLLEINLNNTALANNNTITMGSGGGYLLHNGTGTVTVNNPITLNSGSSISINALPVSSNFVISNSITTNNAPININNYTSLGTVNGNVTLSGVIGGNGSLTKAGAGTSLILSNNNLYTGTTTINAGTLQVGNGGTTGSLGSGAVTNNGALTFNRNNAFTVSNAISGSGALTQMGTGSTLTLSGNNSYTGATNIDNGILQVTNLNALGCNNINGCGYNLASSAINIATGSQLLITPNLVTDTTLSNTSALITLNGSGVSGTGALRLAPINSTLSLNNNMQIASDSTISAFRVTLNGNITNSAVNTPSTLSLLLDLNGYTQLNGIISDGAGLSSLALSVTGVGGDITGYAILNGNNTFTGATTITNGTLSARNANALGSGATQSASIMVNTGGRLELDNFSGVFGNNRDITLNGYGPSGDSADDYALIIDNGIMGSITLNNNINIGSDTSIYAAPIINMTGASTGIINSAINTPATLMITTSFNTITIDHLIQDGAGSSVLNVVKRSLGSMILTADNNYTGTTSILNNGGTLQIGNGGATGTLGSGAVTNNSTLSFNRNNAATVTNTISGTGSLVQAGSGTTILTANNNYSGVTTINAGALQIGDTTTTGTLGTGTVTNNGALIVNRSNDITIANLINGSGTLTKNGTGILSITNANGYTGLTTVNAGTLSVGNNTSLGTNMLTLNAGTILQTEVTGVTLANDIILGGSSSISNNGLNFILSGDIDGANILTLNGSGTTTIDGAIGGTTKLTGVTANSDLIINGGGVTTTGDQLYANDVTLGNTTTFANDGVGSQNITFNGALNTGTSDVTLSGTNSGSYQFTINDINSASSTITVNASLASTNNSLLLNTGGTQNFVLTSNNTGTIAGITNVTGFNFTNIHNLNGGSGGLNSITAANTPNTWNISANDGGSVTNLTSFSNMQDLIGGTNSDIFNFVDGVTISGTVDGGDANDDSNHFDFGTIQDSLMLTLNMPILNVFDAGEVRSSSSALIATFSQIQRAIGYGNGYIMLPNAPNVKIFADTNPLYANNPKYGAIGDPFYFSNWTIGNPPPPVPSPTPTPAPGNTFNTPIANIVNQPVFNAVGNNNYSPPNMYGYLYDPSVVNKTYIDPILNTTILKAGSACYTTSR